VARADVGSSPQCLAFIVGSAHAGWRHADQASTDAPDLLSIKQGTACIALILSIPTDRASIGTSELVFEKLPASTSSPSRARDGWREIVLTPAIMERELATAGSTQLINDNHDIA
jgi:hypothetical protein